MAHANRTRDWRLYAEFAQALIRIARPLYADEDLGLELDNTVYALDSSTINLCLSVFPWAHFRQTKAFFGTAENTVKTQIWTAISVYVLVAIIKKRLKLTTELYTILQILSLTLFEKVPLYQLLAQTGYKTDHRDILNQLNLFD